MVPRLPPAVPPLLPPFSPIPGWVMSWKERIFSLRGFGLSCSLSVSSESRKPHRACACSCCVTSPAKQNVNSSRWSKNPHLPLQRCEHGEWDPAHVLRLQIFWSPYRPHCLRPCSTAVV